MENKNAPLVGIPHFAVSLLAILTPFAAVPPYLSLTRGLTTWERSYSAVLAAGTAATIPITAGLIGRVVLGALGVSVGSLRVGGGLIILLMAL